MRKEKKGTEDSLAQAKTKFAESKKELDELKKTVTAAKAELKKQRMQELAKAAAGPDGDTMAKAALSDAQWGDTLKLAQGETLLDDTKMLKKAIKRKAIEEKVAAAKAGQSTSSEDGRTRTCWMRMEPVAQRSIPWRGHDVHSLLKGTLVRFSPTNELQERTSRTRSSPST